MLETRQAGIKDIDLIQRLANAIWPDTYKELLSPEQLRYMLDLLYSKEALSDQVIKLNHRFIIINENDIPVGFASYSPKNEEYPEIYRLHKLYVLTNQQGKGTGKFLLNFIIDEIKKEGGKILELNVKRDNPALHFYHKLGFKMASEVDIDIGNGYFMRDFVMEKEL